jgi:hypothetical protein
LNPGIWRMIFNIQAISDVRFSRYRMGEDQLFLLELNFFQQNLEFSDSLTYKYFIGGEHQLTKDRGAISEIKDVIFQISKKFPELSGINDKFVSILKQKIFKGFLKTKALNDLKSGIVDVILPKKYSTEKSIKIIKSKTPLKNLSKMQEIFD